MRTTILAAEAELDAATDALTRSLAAASIRRRALREVIAAVSRLAVAHRIHATAVVADRVAAAQARRPVWVCLNPKCRGPHEDA